MPLPAFVRVQVFHGSTLQVLFPGASHAGTVERKIRSDCRLEALTVPGQLSAQAQHYQHICLEILGLTEALEQFCRRELEGLRIPFPIFLQEL